MPEGPNKSEELLQRYAKQRRQRAQDLSLHPATRRLLQGEVARQFGTKANEKSARLSWSGLWRVLAFSVATGVLVILSWTFWTGRGVTSKRMEMADAKIDPAHEKNVLLRRDLSEQTAPLAADSPVAGSIANGPVVESRRLALDRVVQNEVGQKLNVNTNSLALAQNAAQTGAVANYFADFSYIAPPTDTVNDALLSQAQNNGAVAPSQQKQLDLSGVTGTALGARGFARSQPGAASGPSPLAENADQSSRAAVPLPQVALRSESEPMKRLSETAELSKITPAPGVVAANVPQQQGSETLAIVAAAATPVRDGVADRGQTFFRMADEASPAQKPAQRDRLAKENDNRSGNEQVLSQFSIEQRGQSVYMVDFDGSRYDVEFDRPEVEAQFKEELARDSNRFGVQREKAAALKAVNESAPEYSFRASGSNLTLRQPVVVTGRLLRTTNTGYSISPERRAIAAGGTAAVTAPTPAGAPSPVVRNSNLQKGKGTGGPAAVDPINSAIAVEGTVRIGPTNVQRFRALPGSR